MLCEFGCGNTATHTTKEGKHYCCKYWAQCPIGREHRRLAQTNRMKDQSIRDKLSIRIKEFVNTIDPDTGSTIGQSRMQRTQEKTMSTVDPNSGLVMSKVRAQRATTTKINSINPLTGKNKLQEHGDRTKERMNSIDPATGETVAKTIGKIGGETRKTKIDPTTGLNIAQTIAKKRVKTQRLDIDSEGINGAQRRSRKAAITRKTTIDHKTGLTIAQMAGQKSRACKLADIDNLGRNGYDRAELKCKSVQWYKHTDLYFQGTYEKQFLEEKEQEFGSTNTLVLRIKRGPVFTYFNPITNQNHVYRSDFIQDNKIIYEIKSTFVMNKEGGPEVLKAKLYATESKNNHQYTAILILDHKLVDWKSVL